VTYDTDFNPSSWFSPSVTQNLTGFKDLHGIDVVFTADKSKWTRCPVIETCHVPSQTMGGSSIMKLRNSPSVDNSGNAESTSGLGWFPGYAFDVETGERLNMAFGENSWLSGSNGRDMLWNPTSEIFDNFGNPIFGGGHFIYVFGVNIGSSGMPAYDQGAWLHTQLQTETNASYSKAWKNCMWVLSPVLLPNQNVLETDARIQVRISHPYQEQIYTGLNGGLPAYRFSTAAIASQTSMPNTELSSLDLIRIVPNPYYAYSEYEVSGIDNRVKITNLPQVCTITIFNMSGQLVKRIEKDNDQTFVDWTLKNHQEIPIAGGVYIFHIEVPGVGETIIKWYGAMRQVDTSNL